MSTEALIILIEHVSSVKLKDLNEIEEDKIVTEFYTAIQNNFMDEF